MNIRLSKIKVRLPISRQLLFEIPQFEIPFGTKVLIEGPSGTGKTTLLHLMGGLLPPDEGSVYLDEKRLGALSDRKCTQLRREHFGIIFQNLNLLDYLTGLENVLLCLPKGPHRMDRAMEALRTVGMVEHAHKLSAHLSMGEQQRIAVARVLAVRPTILLADEPTSSLDEANAHLIVESLLKASENKTLILVSHDQRLKKKFSKVVDFKQWVPQ